MGSALSQHPEQVLYRSPDVIPEKQNTPEDVQAQPFLPMFLTTFQMSRG